nr:hypothetical protein [Tanacetum cinerariifolium]
MYKAFNDRTIDYDKLERKLNEALGQLAQKDIEIKEGLKTKAYEISVVKEKHDETSSNSRNKNVDTTPRYKNDNQSGQFRNQRTVNVDGARENVGSPVAEQYDWLVDTDEEVDEQELEAHYSYMAMFQEVPTADSGTDSEPVEQV